MIEERTKRNDKQGIPLSLRKQGIIYNLFRNTIGRSFFEIHKRLPIENDIFDQLKKEYLKEKE